MSHVIAPRETNVRMGSDKLSRDRQQASRMLAQMGADARSECVHRRALLPRRPWEDAAVRQQRHVQPPVLEQVAPHIRQLPGELLVESDPGAHIARVRARAPRIKLPRVGIGSGRRGLPLSARAIAIQLEGCPTVRAEGHRVSRRVRGPGRPLCVVHRIDGEQLPTRPRQGAQAQELSVAQPVSADARATNARRRMGVVMAPARLPGEPRGFCRRSCDAPHQRMSFNRSWNRAALPTRAASPVMTTYTR